VLKDFEPISPLVTQPYILFARQTMPANDLKELVDWLRANPDKASRLDNMENRSGCAL
jgi:tripartite-type tricarboxylate transporter receptor subunit TctC